MKLNILLFSAILFLAATDTKAQPGCRGKYNPYNICQSDYVQADYIFYGKVISAGKIDHNITINRKSAFYKTTVEVERSFKGELSSQLEVYLDYEIICDGTPALNSKYIFNIRRTTINGGQAYYSEYISRPITDYSAKSLEKVFSDIQSALKDEKKNILEGIIFEELAKSREVSLKNEEADRYFSDLRSFNPVANTLIDAVSEQNKKVYHTKSKADGTYKINDIPSGKYKIQVFLSDGRKVEKEVTTDGSFCQRYQFLIIN